MSKIGLRQCRLSGVKSLHDKFARLGRSATPKQGRGAPGPHPGPGFAAQDGAPMRAGGNWTVKSDTRDRPLRVDLVLDGTTGAILSRTDFQSKPWLDRVIGTGIAAHEGQLFGLANQLVSLFTVMGLVMLSVSGMILWWKRKPENVLGAPAATRRVRFSTGLITLMVLFGLYFPFLGGSMILVALIEKFILRRMPTTRQWLGLQTANT
jgi:uncharacterized iron-regulated membrane protein